MEIAIGVLAVIIVIQEIRLQRLVNRMMLQANIPDLSPVRTTPPAARGPDPIERPDTRRKVGSVKIPW